VDVVNIGKAKGVEMRLASYKQDRAVNEAFDTIVIGSGMGGMTAAVLLASSKRCFGK
jgi:predicted NAD/FAD-binding protein